MNPFIIHIPNPVLHMLAHMHNVNLESYFQDSEYDHTLDHKEVQHLVGTLLEGMHFETKEEKFNTLCNNIM